jgi:hypothetical protein
MMTALHNLAHPNPWFRPPVVDPWVRRTHWGAAFAMLAITLWRFRGPDRSARHEVRFAGALMVVMTLASPVAHLHYFVFCLPLVAGLWAGERSRGLVAVTAFFVGAHAASLLPVDLFRSFGLTTVSAIALWGLAIVTRDRSAAADSRSEPAPPLAA